MRGPGTRVDTLSLCAVGRDEAPYVVEWAHHHLAIGFERIYYYDNGCDETEALLAPLVAEGRVVHRRVSGEAPQLRVYQEHLDRHRGDSLWTAFLDIDEFLVPKRASDVRTLLAGRFADVAALAVPWKNFGSGGLPRRPPGALVTASYRHCQDHALAGRPFPSQYKTVIRTALAPPIVTPHTIHPLEGRLVDERGEPVRSPVAPCPPPQDELQLNHYFLRSRPDWERKLARGGGLTPRRLHPLRAHHFDAFDAFMSESRCDAIQRFVPKLARCVEAHERSLSHTGGHDPRLNPPAGGRRASR